MTNENHPGISILIGLIWLLSGSLCTISIFYLVHLFKKSKNEKSQTHKKITKLLRLQRRNKTLTPLQQAELDRLNKSNFSILKQMWKNEHL